MTITILISIILGFVASRMGVMATDFMSYKEVFGFIKVAVCKKVNPNIFLSYYKEMVGIGKTDAAVIMEDASDRLSNENGFWAFILRLINCKFCLTIWFGFFVSIIAIIFYHVGIETFILTPIIAYLITEKL